MLARVRDGSDQPLGLAALAVLLMLLATRAHTLRIAPHIGWLATGVALTPLANAALLVAPPLACALIAALALAAALMAWLPVNGSRAPLAGLVLLALPWIASLQYYGGYPLRVVTAQASAGLLQLVGLEAERSGTAMLVQGRLVIVDAPCSGVQMAWMAWFCACAVAALVSLRDGDFVRRLPWVGVIVLGGNVLRNTVLVALESRPQGLAAALHEGIGLAALALVCAAVVGVIAKGGRRDAIA
ncbi:MAG: exosortase Q, partial [Piscinibacter sp.]|uniref:exosortase Q n=1 Tax=Piscinibacter sp. TaxID=1903157 RepID=UPI003D1211B3